MADQEPSGSGTPGVPSPFSVDVSDNGGATVIAVSGEVDVHTAPALREAVRDCLEGGVTGLVVDLEHTDFMDSTGLGVLLGAAKELQKAGERLVLSRPSKSVRKILSVTGVEELFDIRE